MLLLLLSACGPRPGGPPSVNGDPSGDWPVLPALDREIVSIMNRDVVAGLAACAVKEGVTVWCGGYGERDTDSGALAYPDTPFLLASVSNAVTGVAAMLAVGDGDLDLDADVNTRLPFTVTHPASPSRAITTRHLMSHVAGIRDDWDTLNAHYVEGDSPESLGGFLEGCLSVGGADYSADRNFRPEGVEGVYKYTNVGAALVGYMVEVTSGIAFDRFCEERIFEPLAMNAGWHLADFDVEDVALPTRVVNEEFRTVPHFGFPDYPDGQLRADARSMARAGYS
jgi:CubicO group peptidase (beta-lactamase class C family)